MKKTIKAWAVVSKRKENPGEIYSVWLFREEAVADVKKEGVPGAESIVPATLTYTITKPKKKR